MELHAKSVVGLLMILVIAIVAGKLTSIPIESEVLAGGMLAGKESGSIARHILGPVATVGEEESNMQFLARVDTGANTCSLHSAENEVIDGSPVMEENIGKTIRFRTENRYGDSQWLQRTIAEVRKIRTSEGEESRYLVPMMLTCNGVEREVLVSLNDRSRMSYSMLLGRNFLAGEFIVDVASADPSPELLASGG